MNRWDLFTVLMAALLGGGSLVVFAFFLCDARRIWKDLGQADQSCTSERP